MAGAFLKQARELGINATIISMSEAEDPNVLESAGNAAEGFIISSSEPAIKTDSIKRFEESYKNKFGRLPDVLAANAYDALHIQIAAYQKCLGGKECMKAELHKTSNYPGISGQITIQPDGSTSKPLILKIVRNGTFVRYEE
ncbi:MAG: ABC transporter substrate-binding protein [Candidatus Aenigmarchaeota archaeon]|nr:ABC transporter substrate-binding protein [Candidatus Aenigmarchaeota archaeon]